MRKFILLLLAATCLFATGCASKLMQPLEPTALNDSLGPDETAVVFLRATSFGGAVQAPVVEGADADNLHFVGIVSSGFKLLYKTTPGKHFFVVGGESSELMEADLQAGKTYYAYVSPRFGFLKARFAFVPVTDKEVTTESFRKDFDWCKWYANTPASESWFQENLSSMQTKYADSLKEHNEAKPEDKKIIRPEYGVITPLR